MAEQAILINDSNNSCYSSTIALLGESKVSKHNWQITRNQCYKKRAFEISTHVKKKSSMWWAKERIIYNHETKWSPVLQN